MNSQGYYTPGYNMGGPSNDFQEGSGINNVFNDPMANAAMMYGSSLANQGKDMVNKEVRIGMKEVWLVRVLVLGSRVCKYRLKRTHPKHNLTILHKAQVFFCAQMTEQSQPGF